MTQEEQKLIIYLTRWNRTETMKLMHSKIGKREYAKRKSELDETLISTLELICSKYGIITDKEGEDLFIDLMGENANDIMGSMDRLMKWDKYVFDTENEKVDRKC